MGEFATVGKVTTASNHHLTCNSQFRCISSLAETQIQDYPCLLPSACIQICFHVIFPPSRACFPAKGYSNIPSFVSKPHRKKTNTIQAITTITTQCRSSSKLKTPPITANRHKEADLPKILLPAFTRVHRSPISESREP